MKRYVELKFEDKIITEPFTIDEILIKNKFDWFLDCEVENVKLEILKGHLIFNSGVFFNGNWKYGVFRDGQWKYGTWEGGVWYNGTWYNGIFQSGIIFDGRFLSGKIEGGETRGGDFGNSVKFVENVIRTDKGEQKPQSAPQPVQPEKIGENIITKFSIFENFDYPGYKDWVKKYIKNMDRSRLDYNSLRSIYREFPHQTKFYFIYSEEEGLYRTGHYPAAPRWVDNINDACRFNGVFRTPNGAKSFYNDEIKKYGKECLGIRIIDKNIDDEDIYNALLNVSELNKYLVTQDIPYEGKNTWTVFADDPTEAKKFVKSTDKYIYDSDLSVDTLKHNIKGTKFKGIHKSGNQDYQ